QLGHSADVIEFIEASRAEHARIDAEDRTQKTRLTISEHMSRHLLAEMYVESGRQLMLEGRPQEAIPYFLAARRSGLEEPPLRMLFEAAKRQLPLVPALDHRAAVASAAFSSDGTRV